MAKNTLTPAAIHPLSLPWAATIWDSRAASSLAKNPRAAPDCDRARQVADRADRLRRKGFMRFMAQKDEEIVALWTSIGRTEGVHPAEDPTKPKEPKVPNVRETSSAQFPNAKRTRFRKMLLEMDDEIDAVGIATPDHCISCPPTWRS